MSRWDFSHDTDLRLKEIEEKFGSFNYSYYLCIGKKIKHYETH